MRPVTLIAHSIEEEQKARLALTVRGAVQGVGFRPFVYRLATSLGLHGWVLNSAQGVRIETEGLPEQLRCFRTRLEQEAPAQALIQKIEEAWLPACGYSAFVIRHSDGNGAKHALVLPDIAVCADCLREIFDPENHRYGYPFTNCTHCGPRFSIIERLPYDRPHTAMQRFVMCERCQAEYDSPLDRRFHAQPNACPDCGPQLTLWDAAGAPLGHGQAALHTAADAIRQGQIMAVKGLGGFHLLCDARSHEAVARLRTRKHRPTKPLAVMFPDLAQIERHCVVSAEERNLLTSAAAPIVLLYRQEVAAGAVAPGVAPDNPTLGAMLPYTPLHHLLLAELGFPVVATSGNLSDEPICIDEQEARERLAGVADCFLVHNRPIVRPVDDSVVRVVAGQPQMQRRSRGYAPLPLRVPGLPDRPVLALGANLKNTVALSMGENIFLSQHIGDLASTAAYATFRQAIASLCDLYEAQPALIACDLHPDYLATHHAAQLAAERGVPLVRVQHHYAHVLSCMADHGLAAPVLGIAWDGTGYGPDGTIWGGEFLLVTASGYERIAHLRPFSLPGGDAAVREPRRAALGLLYTLFGDKAFDEAWLSTAFSAAERRVLRRMLAQGLNTVPTSSAGRLFDGIAALLGLGQVSSFEGEAAMALEFAAHGIEIDGCYGFDLYPTAQGAVQIDWGPLVVALLADRQQGMPVAEISARFHNTLAAMMVAVARQAGVAQIALSGGCFQNVRLAEQAIGRLCAAGFTPFWHQKVPPNDGGIALGQVMAALRETLPGAGNG